MSEQRDVTARGFSKTGPHKFRPLRWFDALVSKGRCRHCLLPRFAHPVHCYVPSRAIGDKTLARISWETLHAD